MVAEEGVNDQIVGFSGVVVLLYSMTLICIHFYIPHPSITKKVKILSYLALLLLAFSQLCIVGTYWIPQINNICICHVLWSMSLVFYITGIYCLKFIYIQRIMILNKQPMLGMYL